MPLCRKIALTAIIAGILGSAAFAQQPDNDTTAKNQNEFKYLFSKKSGTYYVLPDTTPILDTLSVSDFYDMSLEELDSIKAAGVSTELEKFINSLISVSTKKLLTTIDNPSIVTLITEEEIRVSGARDLMDVLRLVPGFQFAQDQHGNVGIGIRGNWANEGKVLLMMDGIELNETFTARLFFGNHYPVEHIKRIEIIRGPGSVIYGGTAELAVVNIITRSPEDLSGMSVSANAGGMNNSFGRAGGDLYIGKKWKNFQLGFNWARGNGNRSNRMYYGFYDLNFQDTAGVGSYAPLRNDSDIDFSYSSLYLNFKGLIFRSISDLYTVRDVTVIDHDLKHPYRLGLNYNFTELKYEFKVLPNLTITPLFNYSSQLPSGGSIEDDLVTQDTINTSGNSSSRIKASIIADYDLTHRINFTGGSEFFTDFYKDLVYHVPYYTDTTYTQINASFFGQVWFRTTIANFLVGARYEVCSNYKPAFVPRLAITKKVSKWHFKAMLDGAYRTPSIGNYLYSYDGTFTVNFDTTSITSVGKYIKPERTLTFEVEAGYQLTSNILLTANYFDNTTYDPIVFSYLQDEEIREFFGPNAGILAYQNFEKSGTRGFEAEFRLKDTWGFFNLNYSFYAVRNKPRISAYTVSTFDRDPLLRVEIRDNLLLGFPQHTLNLHGCYYVNKDFSLDMSASFYSKRYGYDILLGGDVYDDQGNLVLPAEFNVSGQLIERRPSLMVNLHLNYQNIFTKGLEVGAGIRNVLNQNIDYLQPYFGYRPPLPGASREYFVRLSYEFQFKNKKKNR
jgi:outer membrane receptor for ferrienterochelin and colicin